MPDQLEKTPWTQPVIHDVETQDIEAGVGPVGEAEFTS